MCLPAAKRFILLERRVDDHEQRLSSIEERLAKLEAPPNPPARLPLMNLHPPNPFMQLPNALPDKDQIRDEVERHSKRKNAVLFGLQVSDVNETDVVKKLVSDAELSDLTQDNIITVFRDGPSYDNVPRFCKVYLDSIDAKTRFINFINDSRRNNTDGFINLRARPDLSFLQRKRARELRSELSARTKNGESNLFIDYKADTIKVRNIAYRNRP